MLSSSVKDTLLGWHDFFVGKKWMKVWQAFVFVLDGVEGKEHHCFLQWCFFSSKAKKGVCLFSVIWVWVICRWAPIDFSKFFEWLGTCWDCWGSFCTPLVELHWWREVCFLVYLGLFFWWLFSLIQVFIYKKKCQFWDEKTRCSTYLDIDSRLASSFSNLLFFFFEALFCGVLSPCSAYD